MRHQRPEQRIHKALIEHLQVRGVPGLVYLHPSNGGGRSAVEGAILKGMGVMPGAPDLLLWHAGRSFAIELKSETGRISEAQLAMLDRLRAAGVYVAVCHGIDRAFACLEAWELLKGRVQ
jgi:hypothetical protein